MHGKTGTKTTLNGSLNPKRGWGPKSGMIEGFETLDVLAQTTSELGCLLTGDFMSGFLLPCFSTPRAAARERGEEAKMVEGDGDAESADARRGSEWLTVAIVPLLFSASFAEVMGRTVHICDLLLRMREKTVREKSKCMGPVLVEH